MPMRISFRRSRRFDYRRSDAGVTKFNTDPTAEISSHADGDTVREGYAETLRGTVGDANHAIDSPTVSGWWMA